MKIYINKDYNNIINFFKLKDHYNKQLTLIYGDDGIYTIEQNKILKASIHDKPSQIINCKNYNIIIDESSLNMNILVYSIPINHVIEKIERQIYQINNNLSLINDYNMKTNKNNVYFTCKKNNISESINQIISFLDEKVNI